MTEVIKNKIKKIKDTNILDKKSSSQIAVFAVAFIVFIIYALSLIYPFIWLFIASLKKPFEYTASGTFDLPLVWQFSNYLQVFNLLYIGKISFFGMILNSLWMTIGSTLINITITSMTAYTVCKYDFPGKKFLYGLAILIMILPIVGSLPADVKLRIDLGIFDTPFQLIVCASGFGFNFLVLFGFFQNVSWEYAEAAMIDGATHDDIFWRIMLPQASPAILTLFILAFIGGWNDYMTSILYYPSYPTLATGLYLYESSMTHMANYPVYFAGAFISIIPIMLIFILFQDLIMTSVSAGGLKG